MLTEGAVLTGRYRIERPLGKGGMGVVYRAHDRELDETVAVKVLRPDAAAAPGMATRFRSEIKLARRVTHRNVARTYELGTHDGIRFMTMELVEGRSLEQILTAETSLAIPMPQGLHGLKFTEWVRRSRGHAMRCVYPRPAGRRLDRR